MSILNKIQLREYINEKKIEFTPQIDEFQLQPNSIDIRIGWSFYVPEKSQYTDEGRTAMCPDYFENGFNKDYFKLIKLKTGQYFEILPGEFIFAASLEKIQLNTGDIMAILYSRTSMMRRGLLIQSGVVDVKYAGHLIVPILNTTNQYLKLYPGERVCQLIFHTLSSDLSADEADKHGVISAKYAGSTPYNLEARLDSEQEIIFIKKGDIEGLKQIFSINGSK